MDQITIHFKDGQSKGETASVPANCLEKFQVMVYNEPSPKFPRYEKAIYVLLDQNNDGSYNAYFSHDIK